MRTGFISSLIITMLFFSCSTTMKVSDANFHKTNKSVGIFICASTQLTDTMSINERNYILNVSYNTLEKTLSSQGFSTKFLNTSVPYEKAFQKHFGTFNIDEKIISEFSSEADCDYFLIVYYDVTEVNFLIPVPVPIMGANLLLINMVYLNGQSVQDGDSNRIFSRVSLYGWLVKTNGASIITSTHLPLASFQEWVTKEKNEQTPIRENYRNFFVEITRKMFEKL